MISKKIYREHIGLYRWMNDACIFLEFAIPGLIDAASAISANTTKKKYRFMVPKKGKKIVSRRRSSDLTKMLNDFSSRGLLESMLVSLVSRLEAHMESCLQVILLEHPQKLSIMFSDKSVPLSVVLAASDKAALIEEIVRSKTGELMFLAPRDYAKKLQDMMSITLPQDQLDAFFELKATRDLVVHGEV